MIKSHGQESRFMEASFSVGWHEQSKVITMDGSIALERQVKNVVHSLLHTNWSNRGHEVDTNFTDTYLGSAWQNAKGQAFRHAWVIINNKLMNKIKAKSDTERRASGWKLEKCGWVHKERTDAEESRQWTFWAPLQIQKDESSPWHQPNSHTLTQITCHTHTQTRIHKEEHQGRIHEWPVHPGPWCAINKWQPAYWSNKNNGLKRNKTKNKDHNSASIKWPLSRSTYQHFLGCWLIDKCCQSHTENKTKQKLQNDSIFSQQIFFYSLLKSMKHKPLVINHCLIHQTWCEIKCGTRPERVKSWRVSVTSPPRFSLWLREKASTG